MLLIHQIRVVRVLCPGSCYVPFDLLMNFHPCFGRRRLHREMKQHHRSTSIPGLVHMNRGASRAPLLARFFLAAARRSLLRRRAPWLRWAESKAVCFLSLPPSERQPRLRQRLRRGESALRRDGVAIPAHPTRRRVKPNYVSTLTILI